MGSTDGSPLLMRKWGKDGRSEKQQSNQQGETLIKLLIAREKVRRKTMQAIITGSWFSFFIAVVSNNVFLRS